MLANPETHGTHTVRVPNLFHIMGTTRVEDISPNRKAKHVMDNFEHQLEPGEVKILYATR